MYDVIALGELLVDLAERTKDENGYPTLAANPGGAPGNFLAALSAYGKKTAFLAKVGDDTFGHLLTGTMRRAGIDTRGILISPDTFTTLAFVTFDANVDRSFAFSLKTVAYTQLRWEEIDPAMLEQAREIVRRFNELYGETLVEPTALLPDNEACLRLPGTDGKAKMSKSLGNCIYLADKPEDIRTKVMGMFTDPNHLQVSDPGQTEGNPVFMYLDAFCNDEHFAKYLPDYANLDELKAHYQRGGLGDVKVKKFLNNVLQETLEPIRNRREELEKDPGYVMDVLRQGTEAAQAAAADTLAKVKHAMQIDYFA